MNNIRLLFLTSVTILLLTCSQNKEVRKTTDKFKFRTGVNVSHWLSQSEKRGLSREKYITKADFDTIVTMGFDHVRIPVDEVQLWDSIGNKEKEAFTLLHKAIKWAIDKNLRVIVDLHIIRSHYFVSNANTLWKDPAAQEKLVNMWQQLSEELIQYPNEMLAYEILNEAVADNPEDWNKILNRVIAKIRLTEPERIIVIGSNRWQIPSTFPDLKIPEKDPNLILSFHFYTPQMLTHHKASWTPTAEYTGTVKYPGLIVDSSCYKNLSAKAVDAMRRYANGFFNKEILAKEIAIAVNVAKEKKLPIYCGEYGVYPTIPEDISLRYYKDLCEIFNENHIAYCHWCYKGDFPVLNEKGSPKHKLVSILVAK
jgi:endoglucanase